MITSITFHCTLLKSLILLINSVKNKLSTQPQIEFERNTPLPYHYDEITDEITCEALFFLLLLLHKTKLSQIQSKIKKYFFVSLLVQF